MVSLSKLQPDELLLLGLRWILLADGLSEVFWLASADGRDLLYLSPRDDSIWRRPMGEIEAEAASWAAAIHPDDRDTVFLALCDRSAGPAHDVEYRLIAADDSLRWVRDRGFPIYDQEGRVHRVAGIVEDVTEARLAESRLQELTAELEQQALTDPLTGLLNRRGMERVLQHELRRSRRGGQCPAAALIDCDDFKQINDVLGHSVGDVVLREIAGRMRSSLRPRDRLGRIGGDEFLLILPNTRIAEACRVVERLRLAAVGRPMALSTDSIQVTVSVGVSVLSHEVDSISSAVSTAGLALRQSKLAGKNRATAAVDDGQVAGGVEGGVLEGLVRGENLRVVAHPIHDMTDEAIVGYELLSRGPTGIFESPVDFFRLCEGPKDRTTIDLQCFKNCIERSRMMEDGTRFHLNLLPSTLIDTAPERLIELFEGESALHRFCIEISEQQFIGDPSYLMHHVEGLKRRGAQVAIDDVGFGRSSLESLILLQPDMIKIDRALIHGVDDDPARRRSLQRLLKVASSLEALTVAEGIETQEELDVLKNMQIRYGQGFVWERPVELAGPEVQS